MGSRRVWVVLTLCAIVPGDSMNSPPCDRSREVLTASSGMIADGPPGANYTQDSHCEWLIKAKNESQYITLRFLAVGTECSYDYIFVYDGDSFDSPLLGSFSGKSVPKRLTADSGSMLILLYSDTNYVLSGFRAEYFINDCPDYCSGRGDCVSHTCFCERGWGGRDCSYDLCPNACFNRGTCEETGCKCDEGYAGMGCSVDLSDVAGNKWHRVSYTLGGLSPRAAHVAVYIDRTDSLYVFGGYDLNEVLGSLQIYRFATGRWEDENGDPIRGLPTGEFDRSLLGEVLTPEAYERFGLNVDNFLGKFFSSAIPRLNRSSDLHFDMLSDDPDSSDSEYSSIEDFINDEPDYADRPAPRYGHAACAFGGKFAMYGGKLKNGRLSSELWIYDTSLREWSLKAEKSAFSPPALTRHSLTAADDELYLFGGSTGNGEFSSKMFRINVSKENPNWEEVIPRGGKDLDVRVAAHSAVYHSYSHSIIVYGGIVANVARFSKLSDKMFAFDIHNKHWSEIHYPRAHTRDSHVPRERAFHTSTVIGNYLFVFGGYSHRHNKEEICYDNQMFLYHLGCHAWISTEVLGENPPHHPYPKQQGVFAHAAAFRPPATLLIVGGYHGDVNGDLLAFAIPQWLGGINGADSESACSKHKSHAKCLADPECGWCTADEICYGRTIGSNCTTNLQSMRCGGICPALGDCHSCLIHGSINLPSKRPLPSISSKLGLHTCTWCVQNARCHHKDDNYGICGEDTPSQGPGWWGLMGTEVSDADKCRILDKRPGLTFTKYFYPANWSHPDYVDIINATSADFSFGTTASRIENMEGEMITKLKGLLHIPLHWYNLKELLRVCISHARVELILGDDVVAANFSADVSQCLLAEWPPIQPGKLPVDFRAYKLPTTTSYNAHQQSKMELQHNRSHENAKVFTFEYLEPYSNGDCESYDNCLHCLTDSACGWCEMTRSCFPRTSNERVFCSRDDNWRYFTLQPSACPNCSNFISCSNCVADQNCEWFAEEAKCGRRGRSKGAVTVLDQCPEPCYKRNNCSSCLDDRGRCVWCEATQECFSFSVYTSEYQFGLCREWVDRQSTTGNQMSGLDSGSKKIEQCKSCSQHFNCTSCLRSLGCGWCFSEDNPIKGACLRGDFGKPSQNCSLLLNVSTEIQWAYAQCPDVDECDLGLHDCHEKATCTNTHGSYSCKCLRGYIGDGRSTCAKTCYNNCVHGYCVGAPEFRCQCDLGWTGIDCSINCGCNNHSTCEQGIGICDECQDWTEGEFCDHCKMGSYGNATLSRGCRRCDCNGHGDANLGVCDGITGECFCKDNTKGKNCEECSGDYYGDPRHGGQCYYHCEARGMLSGEMQQGLGSHIAHSAPWGGPPVKECLWIISLENFTKEGVIRLTINSTRLNVTCGDNAVYVYDGLPDLGGSQQSQLIGVFCSSTSPTTVEAKSGHMTVHYKQGVVGQGFEAVYKILSCEMGCPSPRICKNNQCICPLGFTGLDCDIEICPRNCSASLKQGICDKGYGRCLCSPGWGDHDCSVKLLPHQLVFTELFNSQHLADSLDHLRKTLPRFGHSLVADKRGSLWMFGGYSLSHGPLNDIRLFDTRNSTWMQVTVEATPEAKMPEGRYFHAAEIIHVRQVIYVHGGLSHISKDNQNRTLGDFWQFSLKDQRWSVIESDDVKPPPLAGHTLTLQKNLGFESLVLIGGFSIENGYLPDVWEYDLDGNKWKKLETFGPKPMGICGHTTIYHAPTHTFYIFGGNLFTINGTNYSNKLFSLHYETLRWSELPELSEYNTPEENLPHARFLHSAATTDEYMIIFGGNTSPPESTDTLSAYVYECNHWISLVKDLSFVGELPPPTYGHAMTLDAENGAFYVVGGWNGGSQSRVTKITLPSDLCRLWSANKNICRRHMGCNYCAVKPIDGDIVTHCHSSENSDLCFTHNGTLMTNYGVSCNSGFIPDTYCSNFDTCDTCLSSWPVLNKEPACHWCESCGKGQCLTAGHSCVISPKCDSAQAIVDSPDLCPVERCASSTCHNCDANECFYAQQMSYVGHKVYNWGCVVNRHHEQFGSRSLKPKEMENCPQMCHTYHNCRACLQSEGYEVGTHECRWATQINQCISPTHQPLYCAGGVCGLVIHSKDIEQCPSPCASFTQCSECLRHARCGWCGKDDDSGDGICTEGTLDRPIEHPLQSTCEALFSEIKGVELSPNDTISWYYSQCPPENECENDHHTCDAVSERCEDLPLGFECVCGPGHRSAGSSCVPVCTQGCVRGFCIKPDVCKCDFGYVGANCSIQCQCNGHSNCIGPDRLNECVQCHNNTMGPQCDKCKPLFVGDPTDNGQCVPCVNYCNGHSNICLNESPEMISIITDDMSLEQIVSYLGEGPTSKARCLRCANNTDGSRCDKCIDGFFRGSEDFRDNCRPCECHGHGDMCDPVTGEKCNCGNNTESDATCQTSSSSRNSAQECWRYQCVKCKDSYMGDPKNGHQCYKMMTADNKMCFDAKLIDECKVKTRLLNPGQTVFFVVIPRFMNVDIRVIIDVTQGALDVFMSPNDSSFVVSVNGSSGVHHVDLDPSYVSYDSLPHRNVFSDNASHSDRVFRSKSFIGNIDYTLVRHHAEDLSNYITIKKKNTLLWVQNLKNRLVLTLPQNIHDLGYTKFYIILKALDPDDGSGRPSKGMVFFRQDQLHIDLFVFFSVFFSCFFLFLSACVVAWKVKQAADVRRARRRHVVEMLHMAKRPFATITLMLGPQTPSTQRKRLRKQVLSMADVRPVAVEPTEDGVAAVTSVFVRLPGGRTAPVRLALASSLVLLSRQLPSSGRTFLRRRSIHNQPVLPS